MDSGLDAKKIMGNIYALAKIRKIKIGELERAANVSAGYLSKLNSEGNTTIPNVEILSAIAWRLLVPVDVILKSNISQLTGGEQYVLKLLDKLILDTVDARVDWVMDKEEDLEEPNLVNDDKYPLLCFRFGEIDYSTGYPNTEGYYKSAYLNREVHIGGDCFRAHIPNANAEVYLVKIKWCDEEACPDQHNAVELYLKKDDEVDFVCSSEENIDIGIGLAMLYRNIMDMRETMGIAKKTRKILDRYLNDDPELPF